MKKFIVWDAEVNYALKYFKQNDDVVIYSQEEFDNEIYNLNNFDNIIILAELAWVGQLLQEYLGFKLATNLRIDYKILSPIILFSLFPRIYFEDLAENKPEQFNILFASGTGFIDIKKMLLIYSVDKLCFNNYFKSIPPLTLDVLGDVNEMLLKLKGFIVDKITHDIKYSLSLHELKIIMQEIKSYLCESQIVRVSFNENILKIIKAKRENDIPAFNVAKKSFSEICNLELCENERSSKKSQNDIQKIGIVLILEDDPEQRNILKEKLDIYFDLIIVGDCHDAINVINNDLDNNIIALVADWRLLKYEKNKATKFWQDYQGYQILQQASNSHFIALISLTAQNDRNIHQIRNYLGLDIKLFKKEHIYSDDDVTQWILFAQVIKNECEKIIGIIASQPNGRNWEVLLYKEKYRNIRNQYDWFSYKIEISKRSNMLWDYYKKALKSEYFGSMKNLKDCGLELKNNLTNVLIARRIFYALYFSFEKVRHDVSLAWDYPEQKIEIFQNSNDKVDVGSSIIDAFSVLRKEYWIDWNEYALENPDKTNPEAQFKSFNQLKNNLLSALCIGEKELPQNPRILPEERQWLIKNEIDLSIQISIYDNES